MYICAPTNIDCMIIERESTEGFNLNIEAVKAAIRIGGALVVKDSSDKLLAYVLFAIEVDPGTYRPIACPIGLAFSDVYAIKLLVRHLRVTFSNVIYSAYCIERLGLDCNKEWNTIGANLEWYKIDIDYNKCFSETFGKIMPEVSKFSREFKKLKGSRDIFLPSKCTEALTNIVNEVEVIATDIYKVNMLSEKYCSELIERIKNQEFSTNCEEDVLYQIPEIVVKASDSGMYLELEELFYSYIRKYMEAFRFKKEFNINSIQFAKYSAEGEIRKGNWHYDEDSDSTLVIYLNDDYEGGGTQFKPNGLNEVITVDKFNVGDSVFFNGKVTPHRGLPVIKGDRYILVFWCNGLSEVFE